MAVEFGVDEDQFAEVYKFISPELLCEKVSVGFPYRSNFLAGSLPTLTASSQYLIDLVDLNINHVKMLVVVGHKLCTCYPGSHW